jgi:hypothetical protein
MNNKTIDKIDEYYTLSCGPNNVVDLKGAFKLLWPTLNNAVSIVDLAGVFAIAIPSNNPVEALSRELFHDFFKAYARLKIPSGADYCERLLEELRQSNKQQQQHGKHGHHAHFSSSSSSVVAAPPVLSSPPTHNDYNLLYSVAEKNIIRCLLKYDLPLRRAFAGFCGQAVRIGSLVSWEEVKTLNLGMEVSQFASFPSFSYSSLFVFSLIVGWLFIICWCLFSSA